MNFASLPDRRAELDPHGPAVSDGTSRSPTPQLLSRVRMAARQLQDLGIGPGDVVALKLTNRAEFVVLLFAAWRLGATITPVNPSLTDVEVARQLQDSAARLLVVEDGATPYATVLPYSPSANCTKERRSRIKHRFWTRPRWPCSSTPAVRPGCPRA